MPSTPGRADVELRLPADGAYASVLRTTAAGLAARLDFTIEDIEDLRIAASEAGALVLPEARSGSDLVCEFFLASGSLTLALSVETESPVEPDYDSFAWQVLSTLATESNATSEPTTYTVRLTMASALQESDEATPASG